MQCKKEQFGPNRLRQEDWNARMIRYRYGKKPARPNSIKLRFSAYQKSLPAPPAEFGHQALVQPWHVLGNDQYSNCYWAGAAHEEYLWSVEGSGKRVHVTTADTLDDYSSTGFVLGDEGTDQGTDMQQGASYRRTTGIRDSGNIRHKVAAYAALQAGNLAEHQTAAWLFGAVGLGLTIGDNQQDQFAAGQPWSGAPGANQGGHYVPFVAFQGGMLWVISWGRLVPILVPFFEAQNDESVAYLDDEFLNGTGKSLEGFDVAALNDDLALLTATKS